MTLYKRTKGGEIRRLTDSALIPTDPGNSDYQAFLQWRSQGNTALPVDSDPEPPVLTPRERLEARLGISIAQLKSLLA